MYTSPNNPPTLVCETPGYVVQGGEEETENCGGKPCTPTEKEDSTLEDSERYGWWLNELESLGVNTLAKHGLANHKEASDLAEAVKQTLYEDYLQDYSENNR